MTKPTLVALGAALIALGQELQGEDAPTTEAHPATDPQPKTSRRGKATSEPQPPANAAPAEPPAVLTEAQLRELFDPLLKIGKGGKVKEFLKSLGAEKIGDLAEDKQPAFVAEVNKMRTEFAKDIEALSM